jgi:redox-sensitive bicupin YhaK (pirin superfamily)
MNQAFIDKPTQSNRELERVVIGRATQDGAGVKLTRVLTQDLQQRLDPFLMLDNFASDDPNDYGGGFPDHPHRGFETVTYMIAGRMRHKDSAGHEGLLQNGGVQWMTAGKGVIHSEMPEQEVGVMEGFQLWLNLPAHQKMCTPWYRDIQSHEIPEFTTAEGVLVRVISGESHGKSGAIKRSAALYPTQALYLDVHFNQDGFFEQALKPEHNAFLYSYRGATEVIGRNGEVKNVACHHMGILQNKGDRVQLRAKSGTQVLLIAGQPLNEPIAQHGPFVMNTRLELMQAVEDYQNGLLTP